MLDGTIDSINIFKYGLEFQNTTHVHVDTVCVKHYEV